MHLPRRGKATMDKTGPYGKELGNVFGLNDAPSMMVRVLRKADIYATEVRPANPFGLSHEIPPAAERKAVAVRSGEGLRVRGSKPFHTRLHARSRRYPRSMAAQHQELTAITGQCHAD
jgi:hypothetical protein